MSGNPRGPKPGTVAPSTKLRKLIDVERIIRVLTAKADGGDVTAARTLLERALPAYKAVAEPLHLPALAEAKTDLERVAAITAAIARGALAPDTGASLIAAFSRAHAEAVGGVTINVIDPDHDVDG